jgi:hypothetical protein
MIVCVVREYMQNVILRLLFNEFLQYRFLQQKQIIPDY